MSGSSPRKPWFLVLRLLVAGLLGGVGTVVLGFFAIYLYVETFDPKGGDVGHRDPMNGVAGFYTLAAWGFLVGAGLGIAADFAIRHWRRRRDR